MQAILTHFFQFINSKFPEYIGFLEDQAIQPAGSKEKFKVELADHIESEGEVKAFLDVLFPGEKWDEKSINQIEEVAHMNGFNDFITGIVSTDLGKNVINIDALVKNINPLAFVLIIIGVLEWLDKKEFSMESLECDINLSKNTRRTWLKFFFDKPNNYSENSSLSHRFYKARKITPRDYAEIWIKFVSVDITDFNHSITEMVTALKKGWVVSKKDLKDAYNIRSSDIKIALEDAVEQPDYPSSWPKLIPDKDKFPYSVSLFIARELSLLQKEAIPLINFNVI